MNRSEKSQQEDYTDNAANVLSIRIGVIEKDIKEIHQLLVEGNGWGAWKNQVLTEMERVSGCIARTAEEYIEIKITLARQEERIRSVAAVTAGVVSVATAILTFVILQVLEK